MKVTTKALKQNYNCICVGYCDIHSLSRDISPTYYNAGVYGWNYDVYIVDKYALCTGYRGMPENVGVVENKGTIIRQYNDEARHVPDSELPKLRRELISKIVQQ